LENVYTTKKKENMEKVARKPARPASAELISKASAKLYKLIQSTRVAVVSGDYIPHKGKFEKDGEDYFNKIIYLNELDLDQNGDLTEQELRLNCNWNNGIAARLPKGGLRKGDILFGFDTCESHFEDGPDRAVFPGKMGIIRHAPTKTAAKKKVRNTTPSTNPVPIHRVLKMYRKTIQ
jgi:hypothetical protein